MKIIVDMNVGYDPTNDVILIVGGASFIPIKAAQWHYEVKRLNFKGMKIPRSSVLCGP